MQLQLVFDPSTEDFMKDLKADWRKWTVAERCVAACFVMSGTVSALYFLGLGSTPTGISAMPHHERAPQWLSLSVQFWRVPAAFDSIGAASEAPLTIDGNIFTNYLNNVADTDIDASRVRASKAAA
jgi:hypothetical protein